MKICLVWIGKTRNGWLKALIDDYLQRIRRFARCSVVEVKEEKGKKVNLSAVKARENKGILESIGHDKAYNILLDSKGRELTSEEFADFLSKRQGDRTKQINFIIGNFLGLSEEVRQQADMLLSLSKLTFTHEMARLILVEQIYRSFAIIHSLPYQK